MNKLRNAILYTLLIIVVFRLGVHIPVPFVNVSAIHELTNSETFDFLSLLNGGGLTNFSVFALGVSPYITASIIIQLLQMDLSKTVVEWSEQGQIGRKKTKRLTLVLSAIFGFMQAIGLTYGFNKYSSDFVVNPSTTTYLIIAGVITIGSVVLAWIGETVNDKGLASGISLVIFGGIVSRIPSELGLINESGHLWQALVVFLVLAIIIVFFEQSQLRIPMYYSKKATDEYQTSWLPIKINAAGVIPVILAGSIFMLPQIVEALFFSNSVKPDWLVFVFECFNMSAKKGMLTYALIVILFTFFYAQVQINPEKLAENLGKSNGYIVGVRPGEGTEKYVSKKLNQLSIIGSIYLLTISTLPLTWIFGLQHSSLLSGTTILILIGVAVEMYRNVKGKQTMKHYL